MTTQTPTPPREDVYRSGFGGYFGSEPVTAADCLAEWKTAQAAREQHAASQERPA